ncbi:MAG: transcription-repair coupling factor [Flavobacteriales bacterium]|nr:transcription-repair coupling factor [Flavobacteriales bacterium]
MRTEELLSIYEHSPLIGELEGRLRKEKAMQLKGFVGSGLSFSIAGVSMLSAGVHLIICEDRDHAAYFFNDMENLLKGKAPVFYYPYSYKVPYEVEVTENANIALRGEVLKALGDLDHMVIVTPCNALAEHVVSRQEFEAQAVTIRIGQKHDLDIINEHLVDLHFEKVDYVYEPGQFSIRGGIVDVFSFVNERPYRIELFGDEVESIREFDPVTQLSERKMERLTIMPDVTSERIVETYEPFLEHLPQDATLWYHDMAGIVQTVDKEFKTATKAFDLLKSPLNHSSPEQLYWDGEKCRVRMEQFRRVSFSQVPEEGLPIFQANQSPQPAFNKRFDLLDQNLQENHKKGYKNIITAGNAKQIERLYNIFEDIDAAVEMQPIVLGLKEGFIDHDHKLVAYTDHQIFERYNRFRLKEGFKRTKEALTLRELMELQPGDFITHIDHGVGKFSGLEKIDVQGKTQEAIRILYRDNDILYVSIHSLHRIAKYTGKEGTQPKLNKLGSSAWATKKAKAKNRVKKLAFDLIKLYAERKAKKGFAFSPDTYLQTELEASFIYEDTPDQEAATKSVKEDMEREMPMDRLVCGDVGFGKTEIAIRAAFKAVADNKQVAVLVPTTVLSFQHYQSFSARLREFPAKVAYLNRFKTTKEQTHVLKALESGEVDIIIGTHKLLSKNVKFHDLGLIIVDEEQKFGVGAKDKLKTLRAEVDTLTLTATPIPRTLQFSLMGARDLSIINTPPPNRYPVETRLISFSETLIRNAISTEIQRGGQVFFVHNRIDNIKEVAGMITRVCPDARVRIGHGQMDGKSLEKVMLDFIDGEFDVLVSTTIIESGIDIPNANTMIINHAQNFGLSDLHQLRGRVGRSNKRAYCYLITPPMHMVSTDARKRLQAVEQFSELGSGMNIAMRDLDIRGAGDLLGAEQSGFISDIGFETYQKILNEAIEELKEKEFKDLFEEELAAKKEYVADVQIETDLEILLPDDYVQGTSERLRLYRELENLPNEEALEKFSARLIDRFGQPPAPTRELLDSLRLKWLARNLGFEKIILRGEKMIGHFIKDQEHLYYQSQQFTAILRAIQRGMPGVKMYEKNDTLRLSIKEVESIYDCLARLREFQGEEVLS